MPQAAPDSKAFHSSRPFLYRSTVDQVGHANAGLIGVMVVTRAADARPRGQPADVDRELFALFQVRPPQAQCLPGFEWRGVLGGFRV